MFFLTEPASDIQVSHVLKFWSWQTAECQLKIWSQPLWNRKRRFLSKRHSRIDQRLICLRKLCPSPSKEYHHNIKTPVNLKVGLVPPFRHQRRQKMFYFIRVDKPWIFLFLYHREYQQSLLLHSLKQQYDSSPAKFGDSINIESDDENPDPEVKMWMSAQCHIEISIYKGNCLKNDVRGDWR